jgi:predicted branched-subunit amino acid permease
MLGVRNSLYGLRLAPMLGVRGVRRLFAAHLVIDETTAMTLAQPVARASRLAFWATGLAVFSLWNVATVVGALGATAFGDPKRFGLDAAVGAAFLGLLWPRLTGALAWGVCVAAVVVAVALTPVLSPGLPVLAAGLVAVAVGLGRGDPAPQAP